MARGQALLNRLPPSENAPLKVIYVVGFARSGTTIIGNILGELQGFLHVGELCRLWRRAALSKDRCGCGSDLKSCTLWSTVIAKTLEESPRTRIGSVEEAWRLQQQAENGRAWRDRFLRPRGNSPLEVYARVMERLFKNLSATSGARVIVDSSKLPMSGAYLEHMQSVSPYYLHVIRDSRGAVFSRQRRFAPRNGDKVVMSRTTTAADCIRWIRSNVAAASLGNERSKHLSIRYEDFVANPVESLEKIGGWVEEEIQNLPIVREGTVLLGANHTVSGNRNRFTTGEVELQIDNRWRDSLRARDYLLITSLTAGLLKRYGYSLRRRDEDPSPRNVFPVLSKT